MKNEAHILLEKHLDELNLQWREEWRFHPKRRWRLDYVLGRFVKDIWVTNFWAIEIEGGLFSQGRHSRGKGYQADLDKYNAAAIMGYRVLRFSTQDVLRGRARAFLKEHLR